MLEFLAAWHRDIEHRKHRLIVIKWPDLALGLDADFQLTDVSLLRIGNITVLNYILFICNLLYSRFK